MSAPGETNKATTESGPESPTTARPLDLDDDDVQESGVLDSNTTPAAATNTTTTQGQAQAPSPTNETAPPKPPRPVSEAQKNETILKEAFPTVELSVIKAVLRASGGRVEPAFHALLEMTDPDAAQNEPVDEVPPPQPPRPQNRTQMSQLEADELYARQLAEHYDNVGAYESRTANRGQRQGQQGQQGQDEWGDDREHSFIDDDLPVIRENLRKGFFETQEKVNGWITNIKKKIEENFDESEEQTQRQGEPFRRPGESSRRSGDYDRYDADPQVLSDDFAGMKFSSDGTPMNRPMANTGMYKPPPPSTSPKPSNGRRVGFKEETEEINMYDSSPRVPPKDAAPASGTRGSKWQPMSAVEPSPIAENDPFSLGDSEDERETHQKSKDDKTDDSERLKKATAEAMADSLSESKESEAKKN
ncbi:CUE domain-containing protein [Fusarium mexicanum]|uniref:CUE domain-containing protein n=1 Tax=Fusarium mexicanum TaxID=751941 RepID=A0A8H5J9S9_9HYPO|nr:CUE domain-containing protein [Fusarium mexicanum]